MRSFWKGSIGFGLVSIPVKAYRATEEHGLGLHQVHAADGGRIRLRRFCELDDAEVPAAEVGRAAETGGGDVVLITEEDLATLPVPTLRTIAVHTFAPPEQIDSLYLSRNYYLEPDANGVRPYVLFAEALRRSGKVAVVKVAFRQRESMGVLRARDGVLVLATMVWPAEVRTPDFPFLDEDVDVRLVRGSERLRRDTGHPVVNVHELGHGSDLLDGSPVHLCTGSSQFYSGAVGSG